jgi:DNA-binding CsgD family transcriptional regulator
MITVELFSRIVTEVHAAALAPQLWVGALELVRSTLNGTASGLITGGHGYRDVRHCTVYDEPAMRAYHDYYRQCDYVLAAVDVSAPGQVHSGESLVALNPRSEFNADWMRPYGMDDGLFVRLTTGPKPCSFLVVAPRCSRGFADAHNVRAFTALVPHFQQALRTHEAVTDLRARTAQGNHPADSFSAPSAVVSQDMSVTYANPALESLLRCSTDVVVTSGRLRLSAPSTDIELQRAVSHATRSGGPRVGDVVRVPRSAATRPLVVHVLPLRNDDRRYALVVIVDPDVRREPPKQLLRRVFSLTQAEAEVALRISRGDSVAAIAGQLLLSPATIKTHLQHVYDKTDTHRQAELVRLVLTLTP